MITGRNAQTLEAAVAEIGANARGMLADISNLRDLDALFANAGTAALRSLEHVDEPLFDTIIDTNIKGTFFTLQKAIPLLAKGAAVVVNSSVVNVRGSQLTSVYAASKAAVRSMARTFSGELIERGIRVNAVSPGPIETPIWTRNGGPPKEIAHGLSERMRQANPSKRWGTPEDVAAAVCFLLSAESSYIVGAELFVDGGLTQL
jgi:NAD(P)-dependent dehydrogenase (short-subunit alcohol dehydrogenase family)